MIEQVSALEKAASGHPYYKFNNMWGRQMQDAVRYLQQVFRIGGLC